MSDRTEQNLVALAFELHVQNGSVELFFTQSVIDFVVIELDIDGLLFSTINNGRNAARTAQAAARTRSLYATWGCIKFHKNSKKDG